MNSALFARLIAQVEDAGPGAMRVLQPLGLKPSQYVKMVADWNARLEGNPSLQAEFARALSTARQAVPRVPVVAADLVEGSREGPAIAVPSYLLPDRPRAPPAAGAPPALTLEQHASMTVDIAVAPEHALEVLTRYRLTPEAKRAVDEYYRAMMAADPEVKDAWHRACQTYRGRR
jgi:hypothetical protein